MKESHSIQTINTRQNPGAIKGAYLTISILFGKVAQKELVKKKR